MYRTDLRKACRSAAIGTALVALPVLIASGCTNYRPLDQGATVPWAKALASAEGGPIDGDRYRVGEGDSLSAIAHHYGIRMSALAATNNIAAPYVLYPGEVLRIPPDVPWPSRRPSIAVAEVEPSASEPTEQPVVQAGLEPPEPEGGKRYVVAPGESLSQIAARHGLRLGDLVAVNDVDPPYRISPGQTLLIPVTEAESRQVAALGRLDADPSVAPPPPLSPEGFLWPVQGELIGNFEQNRASGRSGGITIAARRGTPVLAADNGVVAYAGEALSGYGRLVMIRHAEGYVTLYAHNEVMLVREGDIVQRGQTIAEVGDSGDVETSRLHFELRKGTSPIDPSEVLAGLPGQQIGTL